VEKFVAHSGSRSSLRWRVLTLLCAAVLISAGVVGAQDTPTDQIDQVPPTSALLASPASIRVGPDTLYPDQTLTPGAVLDNVTADVVCVAGYTRMVRDVTSAERAQVYAEYGTSTSPAAPRSTTTFPSNLADPMTSLICGPSRIHSPVLTRRTA
jgi:hypothetical protein